MECDVIESGTDETAPHFKWVNVRLHMGHAGGGVDRLLRPRRRQEPCGVHNATLDDVFLDQVRQRDMPSFSLACCLEVPGSVSRTVLLNSVEVETLRVADDDSLSSLR